MGGCLWALSAVPAVAADSVKASSDGLSLKTGEVELNLGGRLHVDAASFDDPAGSDQASSKVAARRARLEMSGRFGKALRFRIDREFAGRSPGWRNLWLSSEPVDNVVIKGGNFTVPFSGEDLESSNTSPFVERSLMSSLTGDFGLGGSIAVRQKRWTASLGYFTDPLGEEEGRSSKRGNGFVGRATFNPLSSRASVVHFAFGWENRDLQSKDRLRFTADPGSVLAPRLMSSGFIAGAESLVSWTIEAGGSWGPFQLRGQTVRTRVGRIVAPDVNFNGQTIQASWLVTRQHYDYSTSQGVFNGPVLGRHKGALELAARFSRLDLQDKDVRRGTGEALTGGVNWYFNRNVRIMADYTASRVRRDSVTIHDQVAVARLQFAL